MTNFSSLDMSENEILINCAPFKTDLNANPVLNDNKGGGGVGGINKCENFADVVCMDPLLHGRLGSREGENERLVKMKGDG